MMQACIFSLLSFFFPAICFAGGAYLLYRGGKRFLLLQKISNTPTSKAATAAAGLVELHGQVDPREPIKSPVTGTRCAYSKVEGRYFDPNDRKWKFLFEREKTSSFMLRDESGGILIDPRGARINMSPGFSHRGYIFRGGTKKEAGVFEPFAGWVTKPVAEKAGGVFNEVFPSQRGGDAFGAPAGASDPDVIRYLRSEKPLEGLLERFSKNTLEVVEFTVPGGVEVYVMGTAAIDEGEKGLKVGKGGFDGTLLIADKREALVGEELRAGTYRGLILGSLLILFSAFLAVLLLLSISL